MMPGPPLDVRPSLSTPFHNHRPHRMRFQIILTPDDNGTLLATCPDLPEGTTFGDDKADALSHAADAVAEAVAARLAAFDDVPEPSTAPDMPSVALNTQLAMKVLLKRALWNAKVNRAELARRLDVHRPQVDRLFDPKHATRLDQYDAAFHAVGMALVVQAHQAA